MTVRTCLVSKCCSGAVPKGSQLLQPFCGFDERWIPSKAHMGVPHNQELQKNKQEAKPCLTLASL